MLERSASLSVKVLQTTFLLTMADFSRENVLQEEENWMLWTPIWNHGVESVLKETEMQGQQGNCPHRGCC